MVSYNFSNLDKFLLQKDCDEYHKSRFYPIISVASQKEIRMIESKVHLKVSRIWTITDKMNKSLIF